MDPGCQSNNYTWDVTRDIVLFPLTITHTHTYTHPSWHGSHSPDDDDDGDDGGDEDEDDGGGGGSRMHTGVTVVMLCCPWCN